MQQELKIIMSTYYADGHNIDLPEINKMYTMRLDQTQVLLIIEGIFDYEQYKYKVRKAKTSVEPIYEYDKQFGKIIDSSEKIFKENGVLLISDAKGEKLYQDNEYQQSVGNSYIKDAQNNLYHFSCLVSNINGKKELTERSSLLYYLLFGNRDGKEFLSYLTSMLTGLAVICHSGDKEVFEEYINGVNAVYQGIQKAFNERNKFLINLAVRNNKYMQHSNEFKLFFVNSYAELTDWIKRKNNLSYPNLLDFLFDNNIEGKKKAIVIIKQFIRLFDAFNTDDRVQLLWKTVTLDSLSIASSANLDILISEVELSHNFNATWYAKYLKELYTFTKQIRQGRK